MAAWINVLTCPIMRRRPHRCEVWQSGCSWLARVCVCVCVRVLYTHYRHLKPTTNLTQRPCISHTQSSSSGLASCSPCRSNMHMHACSCSNPLALCPPLKPKNPSPGPRLQVGALTMDLIDLEIKRTEHRAQEEGINPSMVAQKALEASQGQVRMYSHVQPSTCTLPRTQRPPLAASRWATCGLRSVAPGFGIRRPASSQCVGTQCVVGGACVASAQGAAGSGPAALHLSPARRPALVHLAGATRNERGLNPNPRPGPGPPCASHLDPPETVHVCSPPPPPPPPQVALSEREKKLLALIQKQDRLLYICLYMLLNLSEDVEVERKMKKKVGGQGPPAARACGRACGVATREAAAQAPSRSGGQKSAAAGRTAPPVLLATCCWRAARPALRPAQHSATDVRPPALTMRCVPTPHVYRRTLWCTW